MLVAVEGCCHGELDSIYASIAQAEQRLGGRRIDLLVVCGDFQSVRAAADLSVLACPDKYKQIGTFYEYYNGTKVAPVPTIFIGGNHEASSYLLELFHGGWVCPNIYYLGAAGCVRFGHLRIAGISGIFKHNDYEQNHFEEEPLDASAIRSIYHIRMIDVFRLSQLSGRLDVFMSHEWPTSVVYCGNTARLLQQKPYWKDEIDRNEIGAPPLEHLMRRLRPDFWFSGHMHVKFAAIVSHDAIQNNPTRFDSVRSGNVVEKLDNPDEIKMDDDDEVSDNPNEMPPQNHFESQISDSDKNTSQNPSTIDMNPFQTNSIDESIKPCVTRFLALDKCLPRRDFLQILDIPTPDIPKTTNRFYYDKQWLAVVRATYPLLATKSRHQMQLPSESEIQVCIQNELKWIDENIVKPFSGNEDVNEGLVIPFDFVKTMPAESDMDVAKQGDYYLNPQTVRFCNMLQIPNFVNVNGKSSVTTPTHIITNPNAFQKQSVEFE